MNLKQPLETKDLVQRLLDHHMTVGDPEEAKAILEKINYYRFSGYALQYRDKNNDYVGADFDAVLDIYNFDTELRSLLRYYIERVECYVRTKVAHVFSLQKDTKPPYTQHYDLKNYYRKAEADAVFDSLDKENQNHYQDSLIVQHHNQKYGGKMPMWVIVEILSFSNLSKLISSMYDSDQLKIAASLGDRPCVIGNHLHCLSVLRNKCAHAGRLYNRTFSPPAMLGEFYLRKHPEVKNDVLFAYIIVLIRRLPNFSEKKSLVRDIDNLMSDFDGKIDIDLIGFPPNWSELLAKEVLPAKVAALNVQ